MADSVPAESVIRVLRSHKVAVTLKESGAHLYTLEKDDFFEDVVLVGDVGKRYLQYLKRKANIPISHFWHPEDAEQK